jgi:quinol monooxygenase YgiN
MVPLVKVCLLARIVAYEGKGDELVAAFDSMFAHVETEPGTELYVLNRSAEDPDVFWFYELYTDGDALTAHGSSDAMKAAAPIFGPLIKESELIVGAPVKASGLAL